MKYLLEEGTGKPGKGGCDDAALDGCIEGTDILVVSQRYNGGTEDAAKIAASVKRAMDAGVAILYLQYGYNLNSLGQQGGNSSLKFVQALFQFLF